MRPVVFTAIMVFSLLAALMIVAGVTWLMTPQAFAQDNWPWSEFSKENTVRKRPQVRGYIRRAPRKRRHHRRVVKSNPDGLICARSFNVTGAVKASKERAKKSAWSAFHGEVKFFLGERYADDRFARKPRFECARSKSETLTSKTVEAVGGGGVFRFRCRLQAIACKPPVTD